MSRPVDEALNSLSGKLSREELIELADRVDEVMARPLGTWQLIDGDGNPVFSGADVERCSLDWSGPKKELDGGSPYFGLSVRIFDGADDGVPVVQIDGDGFCRINVNDDPVWNAEPGSHIHARCRCIDNYEDRK